MQAAHFDVLRGVWRLVREREPKSCVVNGQVLTVIARDAGVVECLTGWDGVA